MTSLTGSRGPTGGNVGPTASGKWAGDKIPSGYKRYQMANYDDQQMDTYNRGFEAVSPDSYLSRLAGGDQALFDEMEAPALKQFSGLQGNLASRFSGMGMGARKSSGFQNTANQAATDFAGQLQSQRQGLQRQAIGDLHNMSQQLLSNRPYDRWLEEKQPSGWESFGQAALPFAGAALGGVFGGPAGASMGYSAGSAASNAWSGRGGGQGMDFSSAANLPNKWGTSPSPSQSARGNYTPLTQGYNQELRMNPGAFGY